MSDMNKEGNLMTTMTLFMSPIEQWIEAYNNSHFMSEDRDVNSFTFYSANQKTMFWKESSQPWQSQLILPL